MCRAACIGSTDKMEDSTDSWSQFLWSWKRLKDMTRKLRSDHRHLHHHNNNIHYHRCLNCLRRCRCSSSNSSFIVFPCFIIIGISITIIITVVAPFLYLPSLSASTSLLSSPSSVIWLHHLPSDSKILCWNWIFFSKFDGAFIMKFVCPKPVWSSLSSLRISAPIGSPMSQHSSSDVLFGWFCPMFLVQVTEMSCWKVRSISEDLLLSWCSIDLWLQLRSGYLTSSCSALQYDVYGHSGEGYTFSFVGADKPPKNNKERLDTILVLSIALTCYGGNALYTVLQYGRPQEFLGEATKFMEAIC